MPEIKLNTKIEVDCFIKGCDIKLQLYNLSDVQRESAWRTHLLTHTEDQLLQFCMKKPLLQQDQIVYLRQLHDQKQCRELYHLVVDKDLENEIAKKIDATQLHIWEKMLNFIKTPLYQLKQEYALVPPQINQKSIKFISNKNPAPAIINKN